MWAPTTVHSSPAVISTHWGVASISEPSDQGSKLVGSLALTLPWIWPHHRPAAMAAATTGTVIPLPARSMRAAFDSPSRDSRPNGMPCSRKHSSPIKGRPRLVIHGNILGVKQGHISCFVCPVSQFTFWRRFHTHVRCAASRPSLACLMKLMSNKSVFLGPNPVAYPAHPPVRNSGGPPGVHRVNGRPAPNPSLALACLWRYSHRIHADGCTSPTRFAVRTTLAATTAPDKLLDK